MHQESSQVVIRIFALLVFGEPMEGIPSEEPLSYNFLREVSLWVIGSAVHPCYFCIYLFVHVWIGAVRSS